MRKDHLDNQLTFLGELTNAPLRPISVSDLNRAIKGQLEGEFGRVLVRGEISNFKPHTSGHFYFSLKDDKSQINAVMFKGFNNQLKFRPQDGMEVVARGKVTVYEPRGNYQIFCESLEPLGAGALQIAFEQLKAKLKSEGLFDASKKRPIPKLPQRLGLITSPTGAAIQDMMQVLGRRYRLVDITLIPTAVQGSGAAQEIVRAIELANRLNIFDVLIVGRGGGSIEDLWSFNEEAVARAIAASRIPIVSAVGHEVDFTIADFVADLRAPTPSAAAEIVVPSVDELLDRIARTRAQFQSAVLNRLEFLRNRRESLAARFVDPKRRLQDLMLRCDELTERIFQTALRGLERQSTQVELLLHRLGDPLRRLAPLVERTRSFQKRLETSQLTLQNRARLNLSRVMALLDSLSPLRVVGRGFAIVETAHSKADPGKTDPSWSLVTEIEKLSVGDKVRVKIRTGVFSAQVLETTPNVNEKGP